MSAKRTWRRKGGGSFVAIPHAILNSTEYAELSPRAVKLLLDVFAQFNGRNNGDLAAAPKIMRPRGWKSGANLSAALAELLNTGFLVQTRLGGLNKAALYGVTWLAVNDCDGKLDAKPGAGAPLQLWRAQFRDSIPLYRLAGKNAIAYPPVGKPSPPVGKSAATATVDLPTRGEVSP